MTYDQKKAWKELSSELFKWVFLAFVVGWLTNQVFFAHSAQAGAIAPPVSEFKYTNATSQTFHVSTWIYNGVQCSAVSPYGGISYEKPVSLSCVKL
jgi:hypothetical protein